MADVDILLTPFDLGPMNCDVGPEKVRKPTV